jgi:glycosyltransferase involved in cell wall biosynthesis
VCVISETIAPINAIGRVAMSEVEALLERGFRVSVVAHTLEASLRSEVEWLKLYVPPRVFAAKWLTGRHWISRALGNRSRFDLVHGHQPQIVDWCDTYRCHFLTRVAHEKNCLANGRGLRWLFDKAQKSVVMRAEDRHYKRVGDKTWMLFNSELTRAHFARLYGLPANERVMTYAAPPVSAVTAEERAAARREFIGRDLPPGTIVAGFLGGLHERKGFRRVIDALRGQDDVFLLMGGLKSEGFSPESMQGRMKSLGLLRDTAKFYAACDVLLLPSVFEPFGYVSMEAAARGVPTIATPEVGAMPELIAAGAGLKWNSFSDPLGLAELIRRAARDSEMSSNAMIWAQSRSKARQGTQFVDFIEARLAALEKSRAPVGSPRTSTVQ